MSVLSRDAIDASGTTVTVYTSDDYAEGGGATLQDIVDEAVDVESAIGDETTASQEADSTAPANLIERVTALVDALTSGQADDELRIALASDLLSGNLDVNVDSQTGDLDVNLATDSLTGNLDVDLAEVSSAPIDVSAAEVDVDLNTQSLARLTQKLELTNGTSYAEIYRNANDLQVAVQQWNAGVLSVQEDTPLDVSAAVVSVQEDTPLDVSAATVTVDDSGNFAISSLPSIPAGNNNIGSVNVDGQPLDVSAATVNVQEDTPLDVSAATVTVTDDGAFDVNSLPSLPSGNNNVGSVNIDGQPLDVSAATVSVQESAALDVSAATVDVQEATALDVSAATVPTEQQTPLQLEDSTGTNIDPASDPGVRGGATQQDIVDEIDNAALSIVAANEEGTLLTDATTAQSTSTQTVSSYKGVIVWVNIDSISGTSPSLTAKIQRESPGGVVQDVLSTGSLTNTGLTTLQVHPSVPDVSNERAGELLGRDWRVDVTLDTADGDESYQYDIEYTYIE